MYSYALPMIIFSCAIRTPFNFIGLSIMATKQSTQAQTQTELVSLKDLGYAVASNLDDLETRARWFVDNVSGAKNDSISKEDKAEIYSGFTMRYASKVPDTTYIITSDNVYVPATEQALAKFPKASKVTLNLYTCLGYSQQAFGKLKSECPSLHAIYAPMRTKHSNYCGEAWKALTKKAKEIVNGKTARVAQAHEFESRIKIMFDALDKGVLNGAKRGDTTAIPKRYEQAKLAFYKSWDSYKA